MWKTPQALEKPTLAMKRAAVVCSGWVCVQVVDAVMEAIQMPFQFESPATSSSSMAGSKVLLWSVHRFSIVVKAMHHHAQQPTTFAFMTISAIRIQHTKTSHCLTHFALKPPH